VKKYQQKGDVNGIPFFMSALLLRKNNYLSAATKITI